MYITSHNAYYVVEIFYILVVFEQKEKEKKMQRISFFDFKTLFSLKSSMSNIQDSIIAPIIYSLEDDLFSACLDFLTSGEKRNICFDEYSTDTIETSMGCSYPEAIVIIHNIKKHPDYAFAIFDPDIVE